MFILLTIFQTVNGAVLASKNAGDIGRQKREVSDLLSSLAQQFFNKGGQQGVSDLNDANSESKMGVLQRYLGSALVGAMVGGNSRDDLVTRILNKFTGGGNSNIQTNYGNNNRGSYGTGTAYGGSPSRPSGSGSGGGLNREPLPGSNTKHGVSIIDSRPSDRNRVPSPADDHDDDQYDSDRGSRPGGRRPSSSGGRNNNYGNNNDDSDTESANGDRWGNTGNSRSRSTERGNSGLRRVGSETDISGGSGRRANPQEADY